MFLGTFKIKREKNGRIVIPKKLNKELGDASDLVLLGCGDYFEVWTQEKWAREQKEIQKVLKEAYDQK